MISDPDGTLSLVTAVIIGAVGLTLYGVASGAQVGFERTSEGKLEKLCEKRPDKLKKAQYHLAHPQRFLSTISMIRLASGMTPAVCFCLALARPLATAMGTFSGSLLLSLGIILACTVLVWLFFGSLLPRKLAANMPETSLLRTQFLINVLAVLLRPATIVLTAISNAIVKGLGKDPHMEDQPVTEEQILRMVDESEEDGEIAGVEADMIENIFDFNDKSVSEIMTHRTDLVAVEDTATVQDVVNIAVNHGYSRIPVYHDNIDTIIGVVYVKDLLKLIGKPLSRNIRVLHMMRKPYLVPESKHIHKLFSEMTERKIQFAILIDEYGGTAGVVTMEDVLESIVGNIQDEYDNEDNEIFKLNETMFTVDGATPVGEVADLLEMELPEGDYDTIAGMVVSLLGNLPDENEFPSVMVGTVEFHVLEFEEHRIEKVLIERHPELDTQEESEN